MAKSKKIYKKLKGFYPELDRAIDMVPEDKCWRLLFTRREAKMNVVFAMYIASDEDIALFESLCGFSMPSSVYETANGRIPHIGVDLTALEEDSCRVYTDEFNAGMDERFQAVGYYVNPNTGEILGQKMYWRNLEEQCFDVEYFDTQFNKIDENKEIVCDQSFWGGPSKIVDLAKSINAKCNFTRKANKDQAYLLIGVKPQI